MGELVQVDDALANPIVVLGHARAATTALASVINYHPDVGPRPEAIEQARSVADLLSHTRDRRLHLDYSSQLERKELWFAHLGGDEVFTHMGRELIMEDGPSEQVIASIRSSLSQNLEGRRLMIKSPTNTFRIKVIRKILPTAKFVVLLREGESVVASWGLRHYGFGRSVDWGELRVKKLGYRRGIRVFARKWQETLDYALRFDGDADLMFVTHRQFVSNTRSTLNRIADFLGLSLQPYFDQVQLVEEPDKWKTTIPWRHRRYLSRICHEGNRRLRELEQS